MSQVFPRGELPTVFHNLIRESVSFLACVDGVKTLNQWEGSENTCWES